MTERLNEPAPKMRVDHVALRQLADMGFPEARARKALILNKMSVVAAMEWLFQNETDPDIDDPLPELEMCTIQDTSSLGAEGGLETNVAVSNSNQPPFRNILDSIRAFRKREFRPNHRALQRLIEMGFKENEAVDALLMFRNDQDAACDWLLGERKEQVPTVEEGLEPGSLIYQAIMDNPVVQLGLNNPRCLLAFLQMLENPLFANQWLSDPETGPILMQVSRIYQMRLDIEGIASSTSSNEVASVSSTSTFVSTSLPSALLTTTSVSTLSISPSNPTTTLASALSVSPSNPTTTSVSTLSISPSTVPSTTVPASPTVLLMPTTLSTSASDPSNTSSSKPFFSSGTR